MEGRPSEGRNPSEASRVEAAAAQVRNGVGAQGAHLLLGREGSDEAVVGDGAQGNGLLARLAVAGWGDENACVVCE